VLGTAGWTGHFLAHDADEHAGFGGLLLLVMVNGAAWIIIITGVMILVAAGAIGGSISLGLIFVACLLASVIGIRTYLAAHF
jgi:hypothetical protein